jgi:hypothetical protein
MIFVVIMALLAPKRLGTGASLFSEIQQKLKLLLNLQFAFYLVNFKKEAPSFGF